jgi:hypothetical protein
MVSTGRKLVDVKRIMELLLKLMEKPPGGQLLREDNVKNVY